MKAWFYGAYENIGEQVNVVLVQQKEVKWETETASQSSWDELIFGEKQSTKPSTLTDDPHAMASVLKNITPKLLQRWRACRFVDKVNVRSVVICYYNITITVLQCYNFAALYLHVI